jgi:hypothetical protein
LNFSFLSSQIRLGEKQHDFVLADRDLFGLQRNGLLSLGIALERMF